MRMKQAFLMLIFIFIFAAPSECAGSEEAQSLFYQGNTRYSEGDFDGAIASYEEALGLGLESGPLYYNLGNACFKGGSLGRAILNYLRAKRLMPTDADLNSNLEHARSLIKGGVAVPQRKWLARIFFKLAASFELDRITVITAALYLIFMLLAMALISLRSARKTLSYIAAPVLALFLLALSLNIVRYRSVLVLKDAVVVADRADTKFEPFDDATTFFTLSEGERVTVIAARDGWSKVRRADGRQGWLRTPILELL